MELKKRSEKLDYTKCYNKDDMILFLDWEDDYQPDIYINFLMETSKKGAMISSLKCYQKDQLVKWLSNPEKTFGRWVQKSSSNPMDKDGHGGTVEVGNKAPRYYELYTGEFLLVDEYSKGLKDGLYTSIFFDTEPMGVIRLGNLEGQIGISALHGQLPGERVYRIFPSKETPIGDDTKAGKKKIISKPGKITLFGANNNVIINYSLNKDGFKEGSYRSYYTKNGKIARSAEYKGGRMVGKEELWYDNGQLCSEQYHDESGKEIFYKTKDYFEGGELKYQCVEKGSGYECTGLYKPGQIEFITRLTKSGVINGDNIQYDRNGKIDSKTHFNNGKRDGIEEDYFENGKLRSSTTWRKGKKDGDKIQYYNHGNLTEYIATYKDGKLKFYKGWEGNGYPMTKENNDYYAKKLREMDEEDDEEEVGPTQQFPKPEGETDDEEEEEEEEHNSADTDDDDM